MGVSTVQTASGLDEVEQTGTLKYFFVETVIIQTEEILTHNLKLAAL